MSARDRLESLGALLAARDDVGGVETRDPTTLGGAERAELWVYTTGSALPKVRSDAELLCHRLELDARFESALHKGDQWRDAWKAFYRPLHFNGLLVRPSWIARVEGDPPLEIVLDPGRAFGTGLHETTQLCLTRLCQLAHDGYSPPRVLDLGCGSGVLALAAARLFADARVVAADTDADAVATATENAEINRLRERVELVVGDLDSVPGKFDLVIANIRPDVLLPIAGALRGRQAERLCLSGILDDEEAAVARAYATIGYRGESRHAGGWCALDLERGAP